MTEPLTIIPGRPDKEMAEDFKRRMLEAAKPLCLLMDEVKAAGFTMTFSLGPDAMGRSVVTQLGVSKVF